MAMACCAIEDRTFCNDASDSFEIVSFSGDRRAIPSCYSEGRNGNRYSIQSNLRNEVERAADSDLYYW